MSMVTPARLTALLATAFFICGAARAAGNIVDGPLADYTVTTWSENDGLPAGRIRAISQDADGYLWLATDSGLIKFDGLRFETSRALGEVRLPVGAVTAMTTARDGSVWLGVGGSRPLGRIKDGTLRLYGQADGFGGSYVLTLYEGRDGAIWAGTFQGVFRFLDGTWQKIGQEQGVGQGSILAIYEDTARRVWLATSTAVYRRERGQDRFEQVDVIAISSNVWQSFSEDAAGTVWISDFKEGFRALAGPGRRKPQAQRRGWGVELLHDSRGNFWVGTQGQGLWRVRRAKGGAKDGGPVETITVQDGVASNAVQSLLEDREGNIWVGTLAGLHRLTPHRLTPIKNLPIPRAIEVTSDGSVWVGTAGGLVRFSAAGRREYTEADGVPGAVILALHADARGDLWISTERGVARYSQGQFSPLLIVPSAEVQRVLGITGSGDTLWLRDFHLRLFRWQNGRLTFAEDVPDTHRRSASTVYAGPSGNLWVGASRGRVGVRSATGEFRSYDVEVGSVCCILEDSRGAVWIGGDEGLSHFAGGRFTTVKRPNGLGGSVKAIVEDGDGFVWVGTDMGILRLDASEIEKVAAQPEHQIRFRYFNTADGVAGVPFTEGSPSALRARDGRLWFITSSGVTVVDPRSIGPAASAPPVRIESIVADARPLDPHATLSLPARTSHLQFGFTALHLTDPMRTRFRYRLDGYDRDWVDAGTSRQATYTNLPPGEYRFRAIASAGDGSWGEPRAVLAFGIEPMFYQTRWFYLLCGVSLFLSVYASWRLHVRQVRRQFALVLTERIRMSRAIHDTLLQGLAALALQVDDLSHYPDLSSRAARNRILAIRRQVEEYIRQARRSILDLRTPSLAPRDLPQALREAAERAIGDRAVQLDVSVNGTPQAYSPSVEEQLLLIGQEAVSNAIQHGRASRVKLELDYGDEGMRLRVIDDGCGFDPERASAVTGHYGLISMRERAEQVRGRFRIASTPGSGTEVETVVPT